MVGHVERTSDDRVAKQMLHWIPEERRKRARPCVTWIHVISKDTQKGRLSCRKHCHWPQTEEIGGTGSPNVLVMGGLRSTVRQGFYGSYLYCVPKKEATRCLIITLANVDRFVYNVRSIA